MATEPRLNVTQLLGGQGIVYQRNEGGSWYVYFWIKSEKKRFRKALGTTDKALAVRTGEQLLLDALAKQSIGQKVTSATLGEVIERWKEVQDARISRGEIRSRNYVDGLYRTFKQQLGNFFGSLDHSIGAVTARDWDRYVAWRADQGVALDTVRVECSHIKGLVAKVGMSMGATVIPDFSVVVPKTLKKRRISLTRDEVRVVFQAAEEFIKPEGDDGKFTRSWGIGAAKAKKTVPKNINQDLERSRRNLLYYLIHVMFDGGFRPHELADGGDGENSAIRWRDVEFRPVRIEKSRFFYAAVVRVRDLTKTSFRTVPMSGKYLALLQGWSKHKGPDDFCFAEQAGLRDGKPVSMDRIRDMHDEVVKRSGLAREITPYFWRHTYASIRIQESKDLNPVLLAKTLGHSLSQLLSTYETVLMEQDSVIRDLYTNKTPPEVAKQGIFFPDGFEPDLTT